MNKEAIDKLKNATDECLRGCTLCETKDVLINEAIALLEKEPDLQAENERLRGALEEIAFTKPIVCDGKPQKEYACYIQAELADQALSTGGGQTNEGTSLEKSVQG